MLPAAVAAGLGPAAPLAYLACAALMALIVLCFAAAGSRVSLTGGLYVYIEVAFGPLIGFLAGVLYWLMAAFAAASVASALAGSLGVTWAGLNSAIPRGVVLVALFAVLAAVNVRGVTAGTRLVEVLTAAKLLPLVVLVVSGAWFVRLEYLQWSSLPSPSAVGASSLVLYYAFAGVEVALAPSGEIRDPARTVPRAVLLALAITTTLYLLVQGVAQGLLGPSLSTYAAAPLAEAASRVLGPVGRVLVLSGAAVSMFGYVSGDLLGSPRALYALGRDGLLPAALGRIHPRFHTPHIAIITYAVLVAALAISSSFTTLAVLSNVAALTLYLLCVAASYELARRDVRMAGAPFALPGGPTIPVMAAVVILWLLSQATFREFAVEATVLAAATLFYLARRRTQQDAGRHEAAVP
ncbi:MAG: APC family permease [Vicinamibacterales bacterium]